MSLTDAPEVAEAVPHPLRRGEGRNLQIQWLRALAAVMVVLYHATVYGVQVLKNGSFMHVVDGRFGVSGVSLFFAISGYLMATALRVQEPFTFLAHRIVRIYPTFIAIAALYCAVGWGIGVPVHVDFAALTLAPAGTTAHYPLRVEWTLVFEVTFYIALFLVALCGQARRLPWIALAWLAVLGVSTWASPDAGELRYPVQRILLVSENVGMAGGLLIPSLLRLVQRFGVPPVLLLLSGVAAWPIHGYVPMGNDGARWLFGAAGTLVVTAAVAMSARRPSLGDNRVGRALARFGDDSYALYLVHVPVIYSLYSTVHAGSFTVLWLGAVALAILAALLLGRMDVGLYRRLKSRLKSVGPRCLRIAIWLYLAVLLAVAAPAGWKLHLVAARQDAAQELAMAIAAHGPATTPEQLAAAAVAAGFHPSPALQGDLETALMVEGQLQVTGWAVDTRAKTGTMAVALFQDGHLLDAAATSFGRGDLRERFATKAKTGFAVRRILPCLPDKPVLGIALGPDRGFALMPTTRLPDCTDHED